MNNFTFHLLEPEHFNSNYISYKSTQSYLNEKWIYKMWSIISHLIWEQLFMWTKLQADDTSEQNEVQTFITITLAIIIQLSVTGCNYYVSPLERWCHSVSANGNLSNMAKSKQKMWRTEKENVGVREMVFRIFTPEVELLLVLLWLPTLKVSFWLGEEHFLSKGQWVPWLSAWEQ